MTSTASIQINPATSTKITKENTLPKVAAPITKKAEEKKEEGGNIFEVIGKLFLDFIDLIRKIFTGTANEKKEVAKAPKQALSNKENVKKEIHHHHGHDHKNCSHAHKEPNAKEKLSPLENKELELVNEKIREDKYPKTIYGFESMVKELIENNQGLVLTAEPSDKHLKNRIRNLIPLIKSIGVNVVALDYSFNLQPLFDKFYKVDPGSQEEKKLKEELSKIFRQNHTVTQDLELLEALRSEKMKLIALGDIKDPSSFERMLKRLESKNPEDSLDEPKYLCLISPDRAMIREDGKTFDQILGVPSIKLISLPKPREKETEKVHILIGPQQRAFGDASKEQDYRVEITKL